MRIRILPIVIPALILAYYSPAGAQGNQTVTNGQTTNAVSFPASNCVYNWVNSAPGIGLPANGSGNIASFTAINTGNMPVTATITATPTEQGYAYIGNYGSSSVSVINTGTNVVTATIPLPAQPGGISASPDGTHIYIANENANTVSVIDTKTNSIITTIPVGGDPSAVAISHDGNTVYVANELDNTITVISASTYTVTATINGFDQPYCLALDAAKNLLYAVNSPEGTISVVNTQTNAIIKNITVGTDPIQVLVSPDGGKAYITNQWGNSVSVIDAATNSITATIPVGSKPYGEGISPDGNFLYVGCSGDGNVLVIDTHSNQVIKTISVGGLPIGISVTPDGSEVYVTNDSSPGTVSVISTANNTVTATVPVDMYPYSLGNFTIPGTPCNGSTITFTITVNPTPATTPTIAAGPVSGSINTCAGTASADPEIQQFTVYGDDLSSDLVVAAPADFEVSLSPDGGYGSNITLTPTAGVVNSTAVYIRSAASAPAGAPSGYVQLTSAGAPTQNVPVSATVNALPEVTAPSDQDIPTGTSSNVVVFSGTGTSYNWTNNTPGIGLAASGAGNIASFTAVNTSTSPVMATITVTPVNSGCTGAPVKFNITVEPEPTSNISSTGTLSPLTTVYGTPSTSTIFSVSGKNLAAGILVSPPPGFEVSVNDITFTPTITIGTSGAVAGMQVYIRLAATTPAGNNYSGNIVLSSSGTSAVDVAMPSSAVTPAPLTITADNKSKVKGAPNPLLTANYAGFVNNETPANLISLPVLVTTATIASPVGQYPITVNGAVSTNYSITYVPGILTVVGNIVIPNTFTPNGDGVNDTWNIQFLNAYLNCSVDIFTRYGQKVYSSIGYAIPWDGTLRGAALPAGTYYYIINLKNGLSPLSGFVALLR